MKNEKGSTLVLILVVIMIFSVLGVSLMSQVGNENKLTVKSEKEMQARNLAESGLTYFEKDYQENLTDIASILEKYDEEKKREPVIDTNSEKAIIEKVEIEDKGKNIIKVTSKGIVDNDEEVTVIGTYKVPEIVEERTIELAKFESAFPKDFTGDRNCVLCIGSDVLGLGLIDIPHSEEFYPVPDDSVLESDILFGLLGFSIGKGDRFDWIEAKGFEALAVKDDSAALAKARLGKEENPLLSLDLLDFNKEEENINVVINGGFKNFEFLWFLKSYRYNHIYFQKLAVVGNVLIQQRLKGMDTDDNDRRYFTFNEGLYVNRNLIIGGDQDGEISSLGLLGDMVVMEDLVISDANIKADARHTCTSNTETDDCKYLLDTPEDHLLNIHVHGDVTIENSCFSVKDGNYNIRIITNGKITFKDLNGCTSYPGFFYAEDGVVFQEGESILSDQTGEKKYGYLDYDNKQIIDNTEYENIYSLTPLGREIK